MSISIHIKLFIFPLIPLIFAGNKISAYLRHLRETVYSKQILLVKGELRSIYTNK